MPIRPAVPAYLPPHRIKRVLIPERYSPTATMLWSSLTLAAAATLGASGASASILSGASFMPGFSVLSERDFRDYFRLTKRQEVRCGADFGGESCPDNLCCSQFGYCGDTDIFCSEIARCQPDYGRCGDAPVEEPPTEIEEPPTEETSTDPEEPPTETGLPPGTDLTVSTDGMCGNTTTCAGSDFGGCCSEFFWCGSGAEYCGTGCQSAFGECEDAPETPETPPETTETPETPEDPETSETPDQPDTGGLPVSTDGTCGGDLGVTCIGSEAGNCCSRWGFCGDADLNCLTAVGCQPEFGECRD